MSYRYFSAGKEHLDELRRADGDALDAYFHARIAEYNHAYRHDELVTIGLFDDISPLAPGVAFDLLPRAVEITLKWRDGTLLDLAVSLLANLARASRTTEMPDELQRWPQISAAVDEWLESELVDRRDMQIAWDSLRSHYRRA